MMPEQQQRILGYFIEEAKDHLNTIEQGLLNLQATIQDPDMVSEVFRAAHSVKGGAAMLSLGSIQTVSHRLEDYFKVLREAPTTQVDRDLETMFLQVFDGLQALLEELQGPFGLTEEKAQEVMTDVEPVFDRLEAHLNELVAVAPAVAPEAPKVAATASARSAPVTATSSEDSALKLVFSSDVPGHLREMLTLFKQADTDASRSALQARCDALKRVGEQFDLSCWCDLTAAAYQAVGNPEQTYRSLAPVVIKELKAAQEQVLAGRAAAITVSAELESLMPMPVDTDVAIDDIDSLLDDALATTEEADLTDLFTAESESATAAEADLDWLETSTTDLNALDDGDDLTDSLSALTDVSPATAPLREPTVGAAELNSLADLFEGEVSELDSPWEEISESEAAIADAPGPDLELDSDFSDLLGTSLEDEETPDHDSDLADLFGDTDAFGSQESSTDATGATSTETDDSDLDDLLNLADTSDDSATATTADTSDDGLDALLDGFDSGEDDATATELGLDDVTNAADTTGEDFDFDLDVAADDNLDLDFEETATASADDNDDFDDLFGAEASAAPATESTTSDQPPEVTPVAAVATSSDASFEAISDPWSFEDATAEAEDDGSALDALDELWTEQAEETAESADDADLDFSDFPELDAEAAAADATSAAGLDEQLAAEVDTAEDEFGDLFGAEDEGEALDLSASDAETDQAANSLELDADAFDAEALTIDDDSTDTDFDALLDNTAAPQADAASETDDDFGGLFDGGTEETADTDLGFLSEGESEAIAPDDDLADFDLGDQHTDETALFGEADTAAEDDMAELFNDDAGLSDAANIFPDEDPAATDDADLDDLLEDTSATTSEADWDLDEGADDETADLDLTFANSSDEELSLDANEDFEALSASAESPLETADHTDESEAADLFAEDDGAIAATADTASDTDDFFNTDAATPAANANADASRDDIDDFFSTPELSAETPAATDESTVATAEAPPPEAASTDDFDAIAATDPTDETDLDFALAAEEADPATDVADLDLDFTAEDTGNDVGDPGLDLDFAAEDAHAGAADLDLDFADADTADTGDDLDLGFAAEDSGADGSDFDLDFAAEDAPASDPDLDLDFSDAATDDAAVTEAGLGDDLDLFGEDATDEAEFNDLDLGDADASADIEGDLPDATGELDGELDSLWDEAADATTATPNGVAEGLLTDDEAGEDFDLDFGDAEDIDEAAADETAFDDLESLLDEPPTAAPMTDATAVGATAADDFDELDSLLGDDAPPAGTIANGEQRGVDFDELDALIGDDSADSGTAPVTTDDGGGDDFGDLEKLLEEADQTLGGSSSSIRTAGPGRSTRRVGGIVDQTMRVSVKHLDNLNNLVGELVVNRNSLEQDQERFRQFLDNLLFQVQQLNDVGQRMRDLYERSLLESSLLASRQAFQSGGMRVTTTGSNGDSHATGASFDALEMDRFTGFHTLTQEMIELIVRVRESSSDIAYTVESTDQIARQFRQVTTQLQEGLNKARMVPFAQTADRLPRAVRDISIKCGKEARLVVEGRDTLIDKMLLERLYDPMTHLVNNAITHGIESPEERAALGKPREGKITVRAFYQGNQTVIYIEDDGAGINADVIKRKAIQKGLLTQAEADNMNQLETYELIFRHGFSTRDQADDFAGRGVGMDVVRTALSEIRGSINIDSEPGKGTSFTIRLPLTLSISKALSCLNNQARIAFPMDGVEDMFDVPRDRVQSDEKGQSYIQWRDMSLTFQPLSELLQFNRALGRGRVYGGSQDDDMVSIVVLRNANTYIGIQVDRVLGEQEIVIKQIEGPVPKPMGIAGATVLGDGRVMPIGDVLELIDIAQGRVRREAGSSLWSQVELPPEDEEPVKTEPTVLIVDDSITVRELLSMSFNKVGYRVEQARDGQEAWEKMRSGLPCDLVFCDIEMPRMDGLELLSRMQKDSSLKNIPIAMLTSRGADRHRQMAVDLGASGYFTKPYLEEALLEAAQRMLKGEVLLNQVAEEAE